MQKIDCVEDICSQLDNIESLSAMSTELLVKIGKEFGERQFRKRQMGQIRKFLNFLKTIEYKYKFNKDDFNKDEVVVMKIYLKNNENNADDKEAWKKITKVMDKALDKIGNGPEGFEDLEKLIKVWEAIVAYYGKGESE